MHVRRSPRAKRISARVDPRSGEVTLVLPRWATQRHADHALRDRTDIPSARPWLGLDMTIVAPATEWYWDGDACVSETFDAINYLPDRQDWDVAFGQRDIYLKVVTDTQTGLALSADFDETITGHLGTTHHTKASGTLTVSKWEEQSG